MRVNEFFNPRSMMTPGVVGGLIMLISNTLWVQFSLPKSWTSLFLSSLFVILIIKKFNVLLYEKLIYFIFNSLIIFSLAINTNFAGGKVISEVLSRTYSTYYAAQNLNMSVSSEEGKTPIRSSSSSSKEDKKIINENSVESTTVLNANESLLSKHRGFFDPYF